jgi:hypothetical protein
VRSYLAEVYASGAAGEEAGAFAARAIEACAAARREGIVVHHLASLLIPADEICLQVFSAPSPRAVEEVGRRAGLAFVRVTEAVAASPGALEPTAGPSPRGGRLPDEEHR